MTVVDCFPAGRDPTRRVPVRPAIRRRDLNNDLKNRLLAAVSGARLQADSGRRAQPAWLDDGPARDDRLDAGVDVPLILKTMSSMPTADSVEEAAVAVSAARGAAAVPDPTAVAQLAAAYRDFPGLRALILRRVGDPELAADLLQDATVTTLEKLKAGEIERPELIGGYLYRVALNHLRNHRRKDKSVVSSANALESLSADEGDAHSAHLGRAQLADAARRLLEELPVARDREVLVRFYLNDEDRSAICRALSLTDDHFNRVIFRARNRFRDLVEERGFGRTDFLSALIAILGLVASAGVQGLHRAPGVAAPSVAVVAAAPGVAAAARDRIRS
jgi:RNA polymerase sigma-70 factor (ECF subfamily)